MSETQHIVLCVDDDPDDREMISNIIYEINPSVKVVHAENGIEAMSYLLKSKMVKDFPCLVILDMNMPQMDGKETLAKIKKDEQLGALPVVILTTSSNPADKLYFTEHGVEFITKPSNLLGIHHEVKRLLQYCGEG
ncbi:MAG: response regulator [Chitinophagaceae bacterium]